MARIHNTGSTSLRGYGLQATAAPASGTRALGGKARPVGLPQIYRGRGRRSVRDLYDADHGQAPPGGRFRWLFSTVLAAAVGSVAILVVLYGSTDSRDSPDTLLPMLRGMGEGVIPAATAPLIRQVDGLNWAVPKSDRMQITTGASSTRFMIHETMKQRRNGREYIYAKPYVRVVARLAPPPGSAMAAIPPFNPFKLYADAEPVAADGDGDLQPGSSPDVTIRVVELLGGILPTEDGQVLELTEVADIVVRAEEAARAPEVEPQLAVESEAERANRARMPAPNTTILAKSAVDEIEPGIDGDIDDGEVNVVRVARGDKLEQILVKGGADRWQAKAMVEAARNIFKDADLEPGLEVHLTTVGSLPGGPAKDLAKFSIFADGHAHKLTVRRGASGEFEASATPLGSEAAVRALLANDDEPVRTSSLYAGLYHALALQNVPAETILQVLKVHAYDTDYRRRIRLGDQIEMFFDVRDEAGQEQQLGELLYTSITAGGETSRFYRFRTADGSVDYFDDKGNHSRRFLMRRPVRGSDVRLTSGFGMRFHPLLNDRKMHTGVDWAAPTGTPILASGNGVVEQAGRKGAYGNYVRIRHANGYQTAYGHMSRIAQNVVEGVKVRQGQVIGFVGSTGLSSGPHLHFEVLVNSRFVNPMSIQVPRERELDARQRTEFAKERARIDDLMHRTPVASASK